MKFFQVDSPDDVAQHAFHRIQEWLSQKDEPVFALPAGATPLPLYRQLVEAHGRGELPLERARFFALDEWWGEGVPIEATFRNFLMEHLLAPAGVRSERLQSLPSCGDAVAEALRYEESIMEAGGIDLAILGIGGNGHIAFNEPGTPLDSRTGLRELAERSRLANAYLFPGTSAVPTYGLTIGIGTLMAAREVVLLASGSGKQAVVKRLHESTATSALPASALILHENATVVVDKVAGELL
jgi:glucosamine-6-phosphate deaminase